jgi:hypothetical protein
LAGWLGLSMSLRSKHCLALVVFCACVPAILATQVTARVLQADWDQTGQPWAGMVQSAALSAEGRCVAIATTSFVAVLDKTGGRELWRWNFNEGNRFIVATKVAVAPKCDWLVFAGGVGYRYVWFAHRSGRRIPVRTEGTPLAVEINHGGTLAVIGSGAGLVYLYGLDGTLRWQNNVGSPGPVNELAFAEDDSAVMIRSRGQSVFSIDGKVRWAGGVWGVGSGRPARDFKNFVAWGEPPHGPGIGVVALLDSSGNSLWRRYASHPYSIISGDGKLVVSRTNDNQNPTEEDGFSPRSEQLASALRLLAQDGSIVRSFSTVGDPVAFASDGSRFMVRTERDFLALNLEGTPLWSIPLPDRFAFTALATGDLHTIVTLTDGNVAWFSAP